MQHNSISSLSTRPLNHLGLVAGTIKELGIPEMIDNILPPDKVQATKYVKVSDCVTAMIINGLGFSNRALYLVSDFFTNKPVDRLIRPNIKPEHLNDDALGNALDIIAKVDPTQFFSNISYPIAMRRKYHKGFYRLDTTSFSVEGDYNGFNALPENPVQRINITYGRSKKHRPDLKQVVLSMVNTGDAGFPILAETLSGNASDKKSFHDTIESVENFKKNIGDYDVSSWIADSALYSEENLLKKNYGIIWITRVPETINEAKLFVGRDDATLNWIDLKNGYKIYEQASTYGGTKQRWILVSSEQAYKREIKTLEKKIKKEFEAIKKELWHLSNDEFTCIPDAEKKILKVIKKLKYHSVTYKIKHKNKYLKPGRPKSGTKDKKQVAVITSKVKRNKEAIEQAKMTRGRFILATNELDENKLSAAKILKEYKSLQTIEAGFKFLKHPWFLLDKLFLKTPRRIAALMAIMALCLMIYTIAEYDLRANLKKMGKTLPNQLNKEISNPTLKWIFQMMDGIAIVRLKFKGTVHTKVANITDRRKRIIALFGEQTQNIYDFADNGAQMKI